MIQILELADGGTILLDDTFLDHDESDNLFQLLLARTTWQQEVGHGRPLPRLTAWYADHGLLYRYSGVTHQGAGWTPTLLDLKTRIETVAASDFNSILLNLYRDGKDSIGFHADDEPELGINPVIASLSLGAARDFVMKHKKTGAKHTFALGHGCLLVMAGTSQHHWLHGVPKTVRPVGQRINLTLRKILETPPT